MTTKLQPPEVLNLAEQAALARAEQTIRRGLKTFIEVGEALLEIRDGRLYRATHATFEAYCAERWGLSRRHGNRLIEAFKVARILGPAGPTSERQARELAPLLPSPDRMREVWATVSEKLRKPTAAAVAEAREEITASTEDAPQTAGPDPEPSVLSPDGHTESGGPGAAVDDGPLLTEAEIDESLTDRLSLHYLDGEDCRTALLAVGDGKPLDAAVAQACARIPERALFHRVLVRAR